MPLQRFHAWRWLSPRPSAQSWRNSAHIWLRLATARCRKMWRGRQSITFWTPSLPWFLDPNYSPDAWRSSSLATTVARRLPRLSPRRSSADRLRRHSQTASWLIPMKPTTISLREGRIRAARSCLRRWLWGSSSELAGRISYALCRWAMTSPCGR